MVPSSGDVAIYQVGQAGIRKEPDCPSMIIVQDKVAYHRSRDQPREGKQVGHRIDVLVWRKLGQNLKEWLFILFILFTITKKLALNFTITHDRQYDKVQDEFERVTCCNVVASRLAG